MESLFSNKSFKNLTIALAALLVILVAVMIASDLKSFGHIGEGVAATNTITVNGTGDIVAAPDMATFTFTITNEAQTVSAAQKKTDDAMSGVLAYLTKAGVAQADVKTTSYDIYPRYEYHQEIAPAAGAPTPSMPVYYGQGTQVLAAYVASESIEVKVRDLSKAGDLLTGVGRYGATNVSGLSFTNDKETDLERQARDKAIADARSQADSLAKSLGVSLVRIVGFTESNNQPYPVYFARAAATGATESAAAQVPSGENKITSNVTVTYEIQ